MPGRQSRFTLLAKLLAALALVAGADWLFSDGRIGSWLGGLALAWVAMLVLTRPALRRGPAPIALRAAAKVVALLTAALIIRRAPMSMSMGSCDWAAAIDVTRIG